MIAILYINENRIMKHVEIILKWGKRQKCLMEEIKLKYIIFVQGNIKINPLCY
jgi:hypothetical protein